MKEFKVFTDGGSRGNPGPAALGWVLQNQDDVTLEVESKYLGIGTNNYAEYMALLDAVKYFHKHIKDRENSVLKCYLDSELVVKQLRGEYKIKNQELKVLYDEIRVLLTGIKKTEFHHIPRNQNKIADKLVNISLDAKE